MKATIGDSRLRYLREEEFLLLEKFVIHDEQTSLMHGKVVKEKLRTSPTDVAKPLRVVERFVPKLIEHRLKLKDNVISFYPVRVRIIILQNDNFPRKLQSYNKKPYKTNEHFVNGQKNCFDFVVFHLTHKN